MLIQTLEIEFSKLINPNFTTLMDLWTGLCGDRFAPMWRDVDLSRFPGNIIPFITVVDVSDSNEPFSYRFWGTGHTRVKGVDLTGKSPLSMFPKVVADLIVQEFTLVRNNKTPMSFVHDIRPQSDEASRIQETLRLPLSNDGQNVTNILSLADWQTDQDYWATMYADVKTEARAVAV